MANYTWSAAFHNTDDNSFRAWGKSVSDALTAVGLTRAGDTGQINWNTVLRPSVNTEGGFEMWRFDDSLQANIPVFLRLGYCTASNYSAAQLTFKVGLSTDGAGIITNLLYNKDLMSTGSYQGSAPSSYCKASFDGSGLTMAVAINSTWAVNAQRSILQMERTRGANGIPNNRGLVIAGHNNLGNYTLLYRYNDGVSQSLTNPLPYVPGNPTPGHSFLGPDNNIVTYPGYGAFPELQYSKMTLGYSYADLGYGSTQTIHHLGADRTYLAHGNYITGWSNTGLAAVSPLIWWEDV